MKIAYDGMPFTNNWIEGMHVYNNRLLEKLSLLYPESNFSFYFQSLRQHFDEVKLPVPEHLAQRSVSRFPSIPFSSLRTKIVFDYLIPRMIKKQKPDLFHALRYHVPKTSKTKLVGTFHDLAAHSIPHLMNPNVLQERVFWYRQASDRSDQIITISNSTRDELLRYLNVPSKKISVIPLAAAEVFKPIKDQVALDGIKKKYKLPENFILGLASGHARKSPDRTLKALTMISPEKVDSVRFVLFGSYDPPGTGATYDLIDQLHLNDRVLQLPAVTDFELAALYSLCHAFVFPSLYEGFGIPILEAMACGAPVITGNVSAMPEVGGSAPFYVDPNNVEEIAVAIERVLTDSALRDKMIKAGLERSKEFSWEKTARETMAVYQKLV